MARRIRRGVHFVPTVLVVDDEQNIRELVRLYLSAAGYTVEEAEDGPGALAAIGDGGVDLVVLDIMLPGMDGRAVCATIRDVNGPPVVMLTARDSDVDKVALFEAGADDYIVKPFSPPELVARVRAVLRRVTEPGHAGTSSSTDRISCGGLLIDVGEHSVSVDGQVVDLTSREFALLLTMARTPGRVFSRQQLLDAVTGNAEYADARGIDVHVAHLREKLGDEAGAPRFVETVRGVGYRVRKPEE